MPLESGNSSSGPRFSGDDLGGYYAKDAFRERLHFLFAQIESEFETLYMENLSRKCTLSFSVSIDHPPCSKAYFILFSITYQLNYSPI